MSPRPRSGRLIRLKKTRPSIPSFSTSTAFIGHASLAIRWGEKTILVDPWTRLAGFSELPKADLILVTHHHGDHLDTAAIKAMRMPSTVILLPALCAPQVHGSTIMKNGDLQKVMGLTVEAVPAYNLVHMRPDGLPFHVKGEGNGYVITIGHTRIYVAGDTEDTPEMKSLKDIDVAFLPMNLPYTMTPEETAEAATAMRRVVSLIYVENPRSAAVARRLGMRPERVLEWAGLPHRLWAVEFDCPQALDGR